MFVSMVDPDTAFEESKRAHQPCQARASCEILSWVGGVVGGCVQKDLQLGMLVAGVRAGDSSPHFSSHVPLG